MRPCRASSLATETVLNVGRCGHVRMAGEKWHYAPMATRLAQCGILTCVVSYTLYPQAKARDMVAELSQALSWTLDNIQEVWGRPPKGDQLPRCMTSCDSPVC